MYFKSLKLAHYAVGLGLTDSLAKLLGLPCVLAFRSACGILSGDRDLWSARRVDLPWQSVHSVCAGILIRYPSKSA